MSLRRLVQLVGVASIGAVSRLLAEETGIEIKPGLKAITGEEAAIKADPAAGSQHGVILLEETDRDEARGTGYVLSYHLRAKILSPEGRSLADVEIPVERSASELKTWWGRTILPDGKVIELTQAELQTQTLTKSSQGRRVAMKGALPGVVPGAVIDYGYVVRGEGYYPLLTIELEREWPVRVFRYRWKPSTYLPASATWAHIEGKNVKLDHGKGSMLVTASNLNPVKEEPYMPPEGEVKASVTFYYTSHSEKVDEFWDLEAKRAETRLKSFANAGVLREAIAGMNIPVDAPAHVRLAAAYDWIAENVTNTWLRTAEEVDATIEEDEDTAVTAKTVLKAREGTGREIDYLFAGLARALGAESAFIYAVDRTERFWNRGLKSLGQFGYTFVGVRAPGDPADTWTVVDPGSGLSYGMLPWAATGSSAFVCTGRGSESFIIPPAPGAKNRSDTRVSIAFTDENETMTAKWSRTGLGAFGMETRRWLRRLDPSERQEQLERMCSGTLGEVLASDLPGLDDLSAPYQIACDITLETNLDDGISEYRFPVMGAWWPDTPELSAATRVHPVVFDYPRADIVSIDVATPEGFETKDPPPPIKIESPYGRYQWVAAKTEKGYHVDRAFALTPIIVKPPEYEALKSFLKQVEAADQTALAFRRREEP